MSDGIHHSLSASTESLTTDNDPVVQLLSRAERGLSYPNDTLIFFYALQSAAKAHTSNTEIFKFLKFHIQNGMAAVINKP